MKTGGITRYIAVKAIEWNNLYYVIDRISGTVVTSPVSSQAARAITETLNIKVS